MTTLTWPTLDPDHQWLTAALEKDLLESDQTPEELLAEARRVRAEAAQREFKASSQALLMMATNYEIVAAERCPPGYTPEPWSDAWEYPSARHARTVKSTVLWIAWRLSMPPRYLGGRDDDLRWIVMRVGAA